MIILNWFLKIILKLNIKMSELDRKDIIRESDGYINATVLCKVGGKEFKHWNSIILKMVVINYYLKIWLLIIKCIEVLYQQIIFWVVQNKEK